MKKPFIDELSALCEGRGYTITAVDIHGEVVEVKLNTALRKEHVDNLLQPGFPELEERTDG